MKKERKEKEDGKEKHGTTSHRKIEKSEPQKRAIVISDGSFLLRAPGGLSPERSDGKKPAGAAAVVQIESPGHPYPATIVSCHEWLHGSFGAELHALAIGVSAAARVVEFPQDVAGKTDQEDPSLSYPKRGVIIREPRQKVADDRDSDAVDPLSEFDLICYTDSMNLIRVGRQMLAAPNLDYVNRAHSQWGVVSVFDWKTLRSISSRFRIVRLLYMTRKSAKIGVAHTNAYHAAVEAWTTGRPMPRGVRGRTLMSYQAVTFSAHGKMMKSDPGPRTVKKGIDLNDDTR